MSDQASYLVTDSSVTGPETSQQESLKVAKDWQERIYERIVGVIYLIGFAIGFFWLVILFIGFPMSLTMLKDTQIELMHVKNQLDRIEKQIEQR